jgi:hypothetical protein
MTTKSWAPNANEKRATGLESIEMKATVRASISKGLKQLCLGEYGKSMCFVKALHPFYLPYNNPMHVSTHANVAIAFGRGRTSKTHVWRRVRVHGDVIIAIKLVDWIDGSISSAPPRGRLFAVSIKAPVSGK